MGNKSDYFEERWKLRGSELKELINKLSYINGKYRKLSSQSDLAKAKIEEYREKINSITWGVLFLTSAIIICGLYYLLKPLEDTMPLLCYVIFSAAMIISIKVLWSKPLDSALLRITEKVYEKKIAFAEKDYYECETARYNYWISPEMAQVKQLMREISTRVGYEYTEIEELNRIVNVVGAETFEETVGKIDEKGRSYLLEVLTAKYKEAELNDGF